MAAAAARRPSSPGDTSPAAGSTARSTSRLSSGSRPASASAMTWTRIPSISPASSAANVAGSSSTSSSARSIRRLAVIGATTIAAETSGPANRAACAATSASHPGSPKMADPQNARSVYAGSGLGEHVDGASAACTTSPDRVSTPASAATAASITCARGTATPGRANAANQRASCAVAHPINRRAASTASSRPAAGTGSSQTANESSNSSDASGDRHGNAATKSCHGRLDWSVAVNQSERRRRTERGRITVIRGAGTLRFSAGICSSLLPDQDPNTNACSRQECRAGRLPRSTPTSTHTGLTIGSLATQLSTVESPGNPAPDRLPARPTSAADPPATAARY